MHGPACIAYLCMQGSKGWLYMQAHDAMNIIHDIKAYLIYPTNSLTFPITEKCSAV